MKIESENVIVNLEPESDLENTIFNSNYMMSKLAYNSTKVDNPNLSIKIGDNNSTQFVDSVGSINKPFCTYGRIGYITRTFIDTFLIKKNILPLHSAMIITDDKATILLGCSNNGKSTFSKIISEQGFCEVIGDDHIICSDNSAFGNKILRYRTLEGDEEFYPNLGKSSKFSEYAVVKVDIKDDSRKRKTISLDDLLANKLLVSETLKYVSTPVEINDIQYFPSELCGEVDINNRYLDLFVDFIDHSSTIELISGNVDDVIYDLRNFW